MRTETINKVRDCEIQGDFVGHDSITVNLTLFQDSERKFVVTHHANIKPVSYFTGRETELRELRQRIEAGRKSVLISGMGGIGKTHICRKLFEEYLNQHACDGNGPFRHIGYIEYDGDMGSSLQNCLKFKRQVDPEQNQEAAWHELEYLAADGKLLLFVDNVDKPVSADSGLQRLKGIPGAIILTSRRTSLGNEFEPYRIGFLDREQCKEIYEKIRFGNSERKVRPKETPDLEYVIGNLAGRHTITVELLAHLARTKLWTVKKLRNELEEKGFCLTFHRNDELVNIQKSYEVLYDLSGLTEAEQNVLEAFSVFPYIPLEAEICNQWLLADAGVNEDADIFTRLYQKGWLQFDADREGYALHPIFAQFIYEKCRPAPEWHQGLADGCKNSLEIPKNRSASGCQQFIPFAEGIANKIYAGESIEYAVFTDALAYLLQYTAEYTRAEKLYAGNLQIIEKIWGEGCLDTAECCYNLARVYLRQGKYQKAEELYTRGLRIGVSILGEENLFAVAGYNYLAGVYSLQGKYQKAEELYERSLRISKRVLGEDHPDIVADYDSLAGVCLLQGKYQKAEELYEKSLRIRKKVLGEDHPDTVVSYNKLAYVYLRQGEDQKAEKLYEGSLHFREKIPEEDHLRTAVSYDNLGEVYMSRGEHQKAEELYEKSLRIRERILGEDHPNTAIAYSNLAEAYFMKGKYEPALNNYFKAYKIFVNKLGIGHPHTKISQENMKLIYSEWNPEGDFEQWMEEEMKENNFKGGFSLWER